MGRSDGKGAVESASVENAETEDATQADEAVAPRHEIGNLGDSDGGDDCIGADTGGTVRAGVAAGGAGDCVV